MVRERPEGVFVVDKAVCPCTVCLLPSQGTSFKFADLAPHYISGSAVCYTHEDVAIKSSVPFHFRATKIPFMKSFSRAVCLVCGCHQQTGSTISFIGHTDDGSINFFLAGHLSNALFSITTCKFGPLWSSHLGGVWSNTTGFIGYIQRGVNLFELSWEKVSALLQPATAGHARLVLSKQLEQIYTSLYVQGGWGGWPTGNGNKVSNSQACCLAQMCLASA